MRKLLKTGEKKSFKKWFTKVNKAEMDKLNRRNLIMYKGITYSMNQEILSKELKTLDGQVENSSNINGSVEIPTYL